MVLYAHHSHFIEKPGHPKGNFISAGIFQFTGSYKTIGMTAGLLAGFAAGTHFKPMCLSTQKLPLSRVLPLFGVLIRIMLNPGITGLFLGLLSVCFTCSID